MVSTSLRQYEKADRRSRMDILPRGGRISFTGRANLLVAKVYLPSKNVEEALEIVGSPVFGEGGEAYCFNGDSNSGGALSACIDAGSCAWVAGV